MFLYTKDLLEKLESYPEFHLNLITFEGNTKKYTIYYIDTLTNDNNNIIINLVSEPKKFIVKENLNYLLYLVLKENPDSIIKLNFPNGEIIKDYNFWHLKELEKNNLALIIDLIPNLEKMFKILLNPFIDYGIAINYINVKVNLSQLSYRTNLLYDLIKEYLSTNFRFISNNPDYNCEDWEEDIIINFEFMPQSEKIVGVFLDKINDDPRIMIYDENDAANFIHLGVLNMSDIYSRLVSQEELEELYKEFFILISEYPITTNYKSKESTTTYLKLSDMFLTALKDLKDYFKRNKTFKGYMVRDTELKPLIFTLIDIIDFFIEENFVLRYKYLNLLIKMFEEEIYKAFDDSKEQNIRRMYLREIQEHIDATNKRFLPREAYGRIGLIDFDGESYPVIITNTNDLEKAIKTNAIGPKAQEMLSKIFTFTDKVEVCVFSKKATNIKGIKEFLDEIYNNYQRLDFLTVLSTAEDERGVDALVDWSLKTKKIYLQSVDTADYYDSDFPYLLFTRMTEDDDIRAAVSIASHFYNNEKTKLNKDLQIYFFADGSCLADMVYYRLLQNEIQRNLVDNIDSKQPYLSTIINKAFDNAVDFLSNHFDDKVEKNGAVIAFDQVHYDYYYNGIYQELTV